MKDELPEAYLHIAPELGGITWPVETVATCAACPMAPERAPEGTVAFTARPRCCTYKPVLANFLVGRILRRGDAGARMMLRRLNDPEGIDPSKVAPGPADAEAYRKRARGEFGRAEDLRCPYWVDAELSCSIHRDRNSVCRTWHCKHVEGTRGHRSWSHLQRLLEIAEVQLAAHLVAVGQPPTKDADRDAWIAWFLWCADRLDQLTDEELAPIAADELVRGGVIALRTAVAERDTPMPTLLVPALRRWDFLDDAVRVVTYSAYDTHDLPRWLFVLLSRLDGKTPWTDALEAAETEIGAPIGEAFIRRLWSIGAVTTPLAGFKPGGMNVQHFPVPVLRTD